MADEYTVQILYQQESLLLSSRRYTVYTEPNTIIKTIDTPRIPSIVQYYICKGSSGATYGIHVDGTTYTQTEHPNGELGGIYELESFKGWSLGRWVGQMGAEQVSRDELPIELLDHVE